ncbi:MAG: choice-of-anchor Q domain-containing protein [bacterium]|nr:choice-of-anchor Q domain-containing protein [bacterium]
MGGGLYGCEGLIQNNIISSNTADWRGGGLCECDGTIQNNLITGNVATGYAGGGLEGCDGLVLNNTIVGNSAGQYGGGVEFCEGAAINCIVWGNSAPVDSQLFAHSKPRYCCIQGWTGGGVGNISADPLFVEAANGDLRLQASSPCINAGGNYYWQAWPQRDMDGNCRLAGSTVDIGCYEFGSSPDSDDDLLCDADESAAGTNPAIQDHDGDGLRDGLEILRGSDPLVMTSPEIINIAAGDTLETQRALSLAITGDEIILQPGTYQANLIFCGVDVTLRSSDPLNPDVVASTVLDGGGIGRVVAFTGYETEACILSGLTIKSGFAYFGAGIYGSISGMGWSTEWPRIATHATIENNVITGNSAGWVAGGLYNCDGLIQKNTISNNSSDWGYAGGLFECNGTIEKNVISGNWAQDYGGGLYECDGVIQNNIITANSAVRYDAGGLLFCDGIMQNNLIAHNSAGRKGGGLMYCHGTILSNTIAHNSAAQQGGGLYWCNAPITNCIIWGNTATRNPQIYLVSGGSKPTYCCIQGGVSGDGNISKDPRFVAPNDYHLQSSSPCVDVGKNEDWMWTAIDLDGNPRIFNGRVDMGAYEYRVNLPPVVRITSPADGATFPNGDTFPILFEGTATDEDGDLSASLVWTSSIDGQIGVGASFSRTLSKGTHTITASATDSNNATGSDSVTITVGTLAQLSVTVSTDKSSYKIGETVRIKVTVTDGTNSVRGADVHMEVKTPKGKTYPYDGITGADGIVYFWYYTSTKDGTGTYSVTATASHPEYKPGSASTTFNVTR